MDDQSLTPNVPRPSAAPARRRVLWPIAAVAMVAVLGGGAGAYFGLRGARGAGSGPGAGPPARAFAAAAYDDSTHQVVLFGGMGADGTALGDTWTWDGSAWAQQHPPSSPQPRAFAAMTYDPRAHDVVLVGGREVASSPPSVCSGVVTGGPNTTPGAVPPAMPCKANAPAEFFDTWLWDGSTWHRAGTTPTVLEGQTPALGTDPTTGQVLLLAESLPDPVPETCPLPVPQASGGPTLAQPPIACAMAPAASLVAWTWNGTSWAELPSAPPASGPGFAFGGPGALASDPISGHVIDVRAGQLIACAGVATGATAAVPCPLNATAIAGSAGAGSSSSGASASALPPPVVAVTPPSVPMPATPKATMVPAPTQPEPWQPAPVQPVPVQPAPVHSSPMPGGVPAPPSIVCCSGTITTWNGSAWSPSTPFHAGPGMGSMLAGDAAAHEVVAYAASGTWTWNGSAWREEHPATAPPTVVGGTLVYDNASGKLLLFGGEPDSFRASPGPALKRPAVQVSDQLWAWDGTTWTQLTGSHSSVAPSPSATPTPTSVPPATPMPPLPSPSRIPAPSPKVTPCIAAPMPTAPGGGTGTGQGYTGPGTGCASPLPAQGSG